MSKEALLIDKQIDWQHISTLDDTGDIRNYYLAPAPYRLLIVCRNGLLLGNLLNRVVDAAIGRDRADPGFSRAPGEPQTKITIFRVIYVPATDTLSRILRICHRDGA